MFFIHFGSTFNVPYITTDAYGRVTASTKTVKIPAAPVTSVNGMTGAVTVDVSSVAWPDYSAGVEVDRGSTVTYTATAPGWLFYGGYAAKDTWGYAYINEVQIGGGGGNYVNGVSGTVPVSQGDTLKVTGGGTLWIRYYPFKEA